MIQRYLGNKNTIAEPIVKEICRFCSAGDIVCDIFSGTVSMSMALKTHNFRVVSNDISLFSYHFANCYLKNNEIPFVDLAKLGIKYSQFEDSVEILVGDLQGKDGFAFLQASPNADLYKKIVCVLFYLDGLTDEDIPENYRKHYFFDTYTEEGANSFYKSLRGSEGHRRFFTPENGLKLDAVMNKIRDWYQHGQLSDVMYSLLVCVVCESVEKISNTQGTYHDFQRKSYDERALKPLKLRLPYFDDVVSTCNVHMIGKQQDSMHFIKEVPEHKLLYIDPPYNFRQYTSYYFMLNLISSYCEINSLEDYFSKVKFVRGQNMEDNFDSTFCKSSLFIPSLQQLIKDAKTEYVVLSYYDARNHVNKGQHRDDNGISQIIDMFKSDMFVQDSFELKSFERTNYQSFQGHSASKCRELLFIGKKRKNDVDR